jgi:hypothetical protein
MTSGVVTGCPDCGGDVRLIAKPGRTRRAIGGARQPIPEHIEIPTCDSCGAEWLDAQTASVLSALDPTYRKRGS